MRKLIPILLLISLYGNSQNRGFFEFVDEEYTQMGLWLDPVVSNKNGGPQIGIEIQKVMLWGFAGVSASHLEYLEPNYSDIVGFGGINFHMLNYDPVRYCMGPRIGIAFREQNAYPLVGLQAGFDWRLNKPESKANVYLGARFWVDHREDKEDQFYGDTEGYKSNLIFKGPLSQESGALIFYVSWN